MAWTNYFDDFGTFASADEVFCVAGSIKFVFKARGWSFAEDGDKAPDFSLSVSALGVQIDVHNTHCVVTIDNTAGRKGDLLQILDDGILSKKLGRLDYVESCSLLQVSLQVVAPGSPSMWLPSMLIACVAWTLTNPQLVH